MAQLRTATYSQDARKRLGDAVKDARKAAGFRSRPAFAIAARIGSRSLDALETGEPTVGETILHAVARALPGWSKDTPRIILEGGPIPPLPSEDGDAAGDAVRKFLDESGLTLADAAARISQALLTAPLETVVETYQAMSREAGEDAAKSWLVATMQAREAAARQSADTERDAG